MMSASLPLNGVGQLEKRCRRHVGEDEMRAGVDLLDDVLDQLGRIVLVDLVEGELLVHEAAGGVVVGDRELGAGDAEIGRRKVEQRDGQRLIAQLARDEHGHHESVLICRRCSFGGILSRGSCGRDGVLCRGRSGSRWRSVPRSQGHPRRAPVSRQPPARAP